MPGWRARAAASLISTPPCPATVRVAAAAAAAAPRCEEASGAAGGAAGERIQPGPEAGRGPQRQGQGGTLAGGGAGAEPARNAQSGDALKAMFDLQRGFAAYVDGSRYPSGRPERISALCTAIIQEAAELQATTNWKWWKQRTEFDERSAREELIDVWHFVVQASIELGLSPADVLDEYRRKNRINVERQRSGY